MITADKIELTPEQKKIHDAIVVFAEAGATYMTIGGYAGTGKSTVIAAAVRTIRAKKSAPRIVFCCFTGKAASVLRAKLVAAGAIEDPDECGTIHRLIYVPVVKEQKIIGWRLGDSVDADLIIVDEASMVGDQIWKDLRSFEVPIIAVGDHGQLPPIGSEFSLMKNPDHRLEKIHRQAADNPIIKLSVMAREDGKIPYETFNPRVLKMRGTEEEIVTRIGNVDDVLFLAGFNTTRCRVNKLVRKRLKLPADRPVGGDRVVCLRNNRDAGIFNGMGGVIRSIEAPVGEKIATAEILMEDGETCLTSIPLIQFGASQTLRELEGYSPKRFRRDLDLFDYGYCLTVHKAQGSEAENVVLFEERFSSMTDDDWRRWLYTGVTRAKSRLIVVGKEG